jgi:UDP-N-acetylmuramoyl-tripeptide--D-alanyl-D-alanine ligase
LAAVSVGTFFGVVMDDVKAAIADYIPDNNRSEHRLVKGINIILDAYNANPTSMLAALDSFNHIQQSNKIVILGSMMELGTESQQEHEHVLDYAMQYPWKKIITVGNEFLNASLAHDILHFDTVAEAKEWFWKNVTQEDWVYLKGSRKTAMEKIIE